MGGGVALAEEVRGAEAVDEEVEAAGVGGRGREEVEELEAAGLRSGREGEWRDGGGQWETTPRGCLVRGGCTGGQLTSVK